MGIAVGVDTWLRYITEVTENTTPTTGSMIPVAVVSEALKYNRAKSASASINSHGQVESLIRGTSSVTGPSVHEVRYGEFDEFFESVFRAAWSTDVLKIGSTDKSFSFERGFPLITTPAYELFSGCKADGFSMSVPSDTRKVDLTFTFMGFEEVVPVPTADWVTDNVGVTLSANPAAGKAPMYLQCATVKQDSTAIATVTGLSLNLSKGLNALDTVDCDNPAAIIASTLFNVSGSIDEAFTNMDLHNDFLQDTSFTLEFTLTDGTSTYLFEMADVEFSDSAQPITGPNQVIRNQTFIAKYDSSEATTIKLTRTA